MGTYVCKHNCPLDLFCRDCLEEETSREVKYDLASRPNHFPILIHYTNSGEWIVVKSPEAIESGKAFVVVCCNIPIKE